MTKIASILGPNHYYHCKNICHKNYCNHMWSIPIYSALYLVFDLRNMFSILWWICFCCLSVPDMDSMHMFLDKYCLLWRTLNHRYRIRRHKIHCHKRRLHTCSQYTQFLNSLVFQIHLIYLNLWNRHHIDTGIRRS